ncbi:hypothetical protein R1flu_000461 [Riccia fluitans]|uniref:Uncharacterized protein n=1 Tax=Riccia fluitans TaxID=41844 RepID=A0ABD1Y0I5_9MARC
MNSGTAHNSDDLLEDFDMDVVPHSDVVDMVTNCIMNGSSTESVLKDCDIVSYSDAVLDVSASTLPHEDDANDNVDVDNNVNDEKDEIAHSSLFILVKMVNSRVLLLMASSIVISIEDFLKRKHMMHINNSEVTFRSE